MPIPHNKASLLLEIEQSYILLKLDLQLISAEQARSLELEGHAKGTLMNVHNLVSYLIGWGTLVLKWQRLKSKQLPCDFPETGFKWNELGKLAQKFYIDYQELSYGDLLIKLDDTVKGIILLVDSLDDDVLYHLPFHGKWPLGRLIQFNSASPYKNARARLRKWKKQTCLEEKTPQSGCYSYRI
ncbi:ClbS/DfsB family four-helix bundle protein [Pedobacter sp. MC2016-24]|uniref:ClbS/DfsB family four-helix bundle protein n=1 Tax=Pedobacter sp. MC2016-24 TaxID=2780090 RepID=UPI00187E8947|nr:ClbS/DfsB family four-helix bundle protein [Pedobacter sp. MC2016-24]MBE9600748.1 ClbS/DfsB family four-helix bundle protein [Pedobacter sp. MC2016-24]